MKSTNTILALVVSSLIIPASAQDSQPAEPLSQKPSVKTAKNSKLNFFIVSKRKKGKLDPATSFNVLRTKLKSLTRPKNFVAIVAGNTQQANAKIIHRLEKYNATIGTIWFDSHGAYKKGYSLFFIGNDEISFKSIQDSSIVAAFTGIAQYATDDTKLVIGSCYGGATYHRASVDYSDTTRMNGDSLMISLGKLFPKARIYGSESWVMTKPGIFNDNKAAVAGHPGRRLFRDACYRPAWENIGIWNEYDALTNTFTRVNSVTLDSYGNLALVDWSFHEKADTQKDIRKKLSKLAYDLYKD